MQLTKQQRKEVYLKAAEFFSKIQGKNYWSYFGAEGFCDYLKLGQLEGKYPEYQLFKPNGIGRYEYWFNSRNHNKFGAKIDQTDRIHALLLAAEMCND